MTEPTARIARACSPRHPRRVLLVGWDAADWQMIEPIVAEGHMPTLAAFRERGSWGPLSTMRPILSPILWNSIATGKRADQHGIHGFTEPAPGGGGVRPVFSTSRRCKAIWNIATQCGLRSHVVGWYASHPAEPIAGVMVSNQFEHGAGPDGSFAPVAVGCIHPPELAAELADCRVHPEEIDAAALLAFVPDAAAVAAWPDNRLGRLCGLLAQTATIHAAGTALVARDDWDFAAVYYEGIDRFGHEFMEFHPPRMEQVDAADFEAYRHCMSAAYRFHDMLLATMLSLAGPETAVVLLSDHGYASDHRRPDPRPGRAGPVDWHRPYGIFAAAGPGIRTGGEVFGGGLLDVAPTVLALLGLPAGADMPGRALAEVLDGIELPPRIPSWETVAGLAGMHAADAAAAAVDDRAALAQLVALGYVEPPAADDDKSADQAAASNRLQLAQSCFDSGQYRAALEALDGIDAEFADAASIRALRASCLLGTRDVAAARAVIDGIRAAGHTTVGVEILTAALECAEGRPTAALERLARLAAAEPDRGGLHEQIGRIRLSLGDARGARTAFGMAAKLDPQDAAAQCGLAEAHLALGDDRAALDAGLRAAELVHALPRAHFAVGRALAALGDRTGALEALGVCLAQAPGWTEARQAYEALTAAREET